MNSWNSLQFFVKKVALLLTVWRFWLFFRDHVIERRLFLLPLRLAPTLNYFCFHLLRKSFLRAKTSLSFSLQNLWVSAKKSKYDVSEGKENNFWHRNHLGSTNNPHYQKIKKLPCRISILNYLVPIEHFKKLTMKASAFWLSGVQRNC